LDDEGDDVADTGTTIEEIEVHANGVRFTCLQAGGEGPLALCLHGFPDCARGWEPLLGELAAAGFRAVAPFMRGYAPTEVPADGRYQYGALVADACGLHGALGGDGDAVLVGHDWGAIATYGAASFAPERWRRVVTAAVPPLLVMAARVFDYDQAKRFWYQHFFLSPLSGVAVAADDLAFLDRLWAEWSPGYEAGAAVEEVKASLRPPGHLEAALDYYRSTFDAARHAPELEAQEAACLAVPPQSTLYLQGADDGCIPADVAAEAAALLTAPGSRVEVIEGAGHFLQYEQPAVVNALIVDFLS
jgi:pimeloyl-ACP methyl ester carboxylesterase